MLGHQVLLGLRFRCQLQELVGSFLQLAEQLEFRWQEPERELREEPEPQLVG